MMGAELANGGGAARELRGRIARWPWGVDKMWWQRCMPEMCWCGCVENVRERTPARRVSKWAEPVKPPGWKVANGYVEVVGGSGDVVTKEKFDSMHLLIEWASPTKITGDSRCFFFSSRRRHTRSDRDWSSDVCSSD